jgi:hypothetical protein
VDRLTDHGATKHAVEVQLTNTGRNDINLPIGTEPRSLLTPGEHERQYLSFTVRTARDAILGQARAAMNGISSTAVLVHPGQTVVYRLPITRGAAASATQGDLTPDARLLVSVQLYRIVERSGEEWHEQVGDPIKSQNTLSWP